MNEVEVTLTGNVSLDPQLHQTKDGGNFLSFRVAVNERRYDRERAAYVDAAASIYRVVAYRQLGQHLQQCLHKGDPVIVRGALRISEWTTSAGQPRTTPQVTAFHVGHDLAFGQSDFHRSARSVGRVEAQSQSQPGESDPAVAGPSASASRQSEDEASTTSDSSAA